MRRFFIEETFVKDQIILLKDQNEIHHLRNVLRLTPGKKIEVFNNDGVNATTKIVDITPTVVQLKITDIHPNENKKMTSIILACAIPKKSKFETIIEKTTELGVTEIIPLKTERTEVELKGDRLEKKIERYQKVAVNAAKQSKRNNVPMISNITSFTEAVDSLITRSTVIIPSLMGERKPIKNIFENISFDKPIAFLIGPEGDFTKEEYAYAQKKGCIAVTLGQTTLKVETAAIGVVAFSSFYSS